MTDHTTRRREVDSVAQPSDRPAVRSTPGDTDGVASTDVYEVDDGVVLFDVDNPLAWVEADGAVALSRMT